VAAEDAELAALGRTWTDRLPAPGQVLLKLAIGGFGVRLPPEPASSH